MFKWTEDTSSGSIPVERKQVKSCFLKVNCLESRTGQVSLLDFQQITASSSVSHGKVMIKSKRVDPVYYIGVIPKIILQKLFLQMAPMLPPHMLHEHYCRGRKCM